MIRLINKLNQFNYTKTGVVTGLILGLMTLSMGIFFVVSYVVKKDFLSAYLSSAIGVIGIFAIAVEIYRMSKIKKITKHE